MRRRRTIFFGLLGALLCLAVSGDSEAGLFNRARVRQRTTVRYSTTTRASPCTARGCPAPAAVYAVPQAYPGPQVSAAGGEAGVFLASLNGWRAMNGRGPVGWDSTLAAYAATNGGVHAPGSSGGGSQTWAPTPSLTRALSMWIASPAHAAILLNAVTVGASPCATGSTCNAR
jgi:hypothetical protein